MSPDQGNEVNLATQSPAEPADQDRTPDVSVIVAVYNSAATLERAIRSALGQTLTTLEVVAYDDGCVACVRPGVGGALDESPFAREHLSAEETKPKESERIENGEAVFHRNARSRSTISATRRDRGGAGEARRARH